MKTKVETSPAFEADLKRLARKYPQVINEIDRLITLLEAGEHPGDKIPQVGSDVYKVGLKILQQAKVKEAVFASYTSFG